MTKSNNDLAEDDGSEDDRAIRLYSDLLEQYGKINQPSSSLMRAKSRKMKDVQVQRDFGNVGGSEDESTVLSEKATQRRYDKIEGDRREALSERVKDENKLRNKLGNALLWMVGIQLAVSDIFLSIFMCANQHSSTVMLAWLSACVIEVIGLVWVITRSIFPFNDAYRDRQGEDLYWPGKISQQTDVKTSQTIDTPERPED